MKSITCEIALQSHSVLLHGLAACRLGLLAAALGDGTVRVWAVPHPAAVQQQLGSGGSTGQAGQAPLVSLEPIALLSSRQLGGSMPACIDWLPSKPHDLLLVRLSTEVSKCVFLLLKGRPAGLG